MKHLTTGIALATLLMANAAMADGGVIKFGHDNKADPFENPAHACTAVFANSLAAGTNGSVTVEVFGSNQLGTAASPMIATENPAASGCSATAFDHPSSIGRPASRNLCLPATNTRIAAIR